MKKSEIYQIACEAIINCETLSTGDKLVILKELMDKRDLEKFIEEEQEKKENESA